MCSNALFRMQVIAIQKCNILTLPLSSFLQYYVKLLCTTMTNGTFDKELHVYCRYGLTYQKPISNLRSVVKAAETNYKL